MCRTCLVTVARSPSHCRPHADAWCACGIRGVGGGGVTSPGGRSTRKQRSPSPQRSRSRPKSRERRGRAWGTGAGRESPAGRGSRSHKGKARAFHTKGTSAVGATYVGLCCDPTLPLGTGGGGRVGALTHPWLALAEHRYQAKRTRAQKLRTVAHKRVLHDLASRTRFSPTELRLLAEMFTDASDVRGRCTGCCVVSTNLGAASRVRASCGG